MISVVFYSRALRVGLAASLLGGCGGAQTTTTGAFPASRATMTHPESQAYSRMGDDSKGQDLIYATGGCGGTCVISYPSGRVVESLNIYGTAICSDADGNVFVTDDTVVVEYAHGGSNPIATLNLPGESAVGCSIDPATNNLAVVFRGSGVDIAVFANEQGSPTVYDSAIGSLYCGYDNHSDLFVDGFASSDHPGLSELLAGSSNFTKLKISESVGTPGQIQWDGSHITYQNGQDKGHVRISRLRIVGNAATIIGTTHFRQITARANQSWIYQGKVFIPFGTSGEGQDIPKVGVWSYPKASKPLQKYKFSQRPDFQGVTVSVAP